MLQRSPCEINFMVLRNMVISLFAYLLLSSHILPTVTAETNVLPGTAPLLKTRDFATEMVDGINRFLIKETSSSLLKRSLLWQPDYQSSYSYRQSLSSNRERFRRIIGAHDSRISNPTMELIMTSLKKAEISQGQGYKVFSVRWPVLRDLVAEGLLLKPDTDQPSCRIVAIPDADWAPEALVGLSPGVEPIGQFARRLAENNCEVIVPLIINRRDTWSGNPAIRMTNQPHREWIYRMAYQVGRHIIGYEVQKILAAVDWFAMKSINNPVPIGVVGYGEGGLLALYSAALDGRIQAALVSGYFQSRQEVWKEPIYRDIWGLLKEFGDAELAALIAPRTLIVEACRGPEVSGPPPETVDRRGASPRGKLVTPLISSVQQEVERAELFYSGLNAKDKLHLVVNKKGIGLPGSDDALSRLLTSLGVSQELLTNGTAPKDLRQHFNGSKQLHRQFKQIVRDTQTLILQSPKKRENFWSKADASSPGRWKETTKSYRNYIWTEVIGRLPSPSIPVNPRTRLIYNQPEFKGYEVVLDVWPDVFAYGILLVPTNIKPGEQRPVIVCQHGLEGRPQDTIEKTDGYKYYKSFAARLAKEGFITYSPQNPYIGKDRFRIIQRKAHPLKLGLFSFILGQHQRLLEWIVTQPFVDANRIGFYGLSYGGKTAVRVPPLLDRYALSICSADFNEWVWKTTSIDRKYSYLFTAEYDMLEFNFANVVNYSELANLMAPRPFMVERGHHDAVAPDEWVAYEFAKVRRFYTTRMNLAERAQIEFFNGSHTINGKGTFEFLKRYLNWHH